MLCVLFLLILSYRQTIKAYPSAGGAYIVTKDNLGVLPAQVASVALLTDCILTVSVSVSAGVAALAARALQYARALTPDDLRAVHIAVDEQHAAELAEEWTRLPLERLPLEIRECPDRRVSRAVLQLVTELAADGETEVSVLIPRREYRSAWHRLLHDRTADSIAKGLGDVAHANVTFVPYHLTHTTKGQHIHKVPHGTMSGTATPTPPDRAGMGRSDPPDGNGAESPGATPPLP